MNLSKHKNKRKNPHIYRVNLPNISSCVSRAQYLRQIYNFCLNPLSRPSPSPKQTNKQKKKEKKKREAERKSKTEKNKKSEKERELGKRACKSDMQPWLSCSVVKNSSSRASTRQERGGGGGEEEENDSRKRFRDVERQRRRGGKGREGATGLGGQG